MVDLTHRRVTFIAPAQGDGHGIAVPRIVVKRDGAVAWIACRGARTRCRRQHADEVHVHDALGTRLLSSAPGRVSNVLNLSGTTLSYEIAGRSPPRAAALRLRGRDVQCSLCGRGV